MEDFNAWLSFPIHESLNHDLAIRRFCPARLEQEQGGGEWEEILNEIGFYSPSNDSTTTPCLPASEVDEFVDSIINMDHCKDVNDDYHQSLEKQQSSFDYFQGGMQTFSMEYDLYGDVMMMMDGDDQMEMCGTVEDFGVVDDQTSMVPSVEEVSHGVDQGLHLVHMLLACAEAVGCRDTRLAESLLTQIWASVSPFGDSLQRVSYCFAMGLKSRLSLLQNVILNGTFNNDTMDVSMIAREEKLEAFQLLYQTTPYIAFGFMVANEAICQAAQGNESLHIIDLGMDHTLQWPSLLRTLASRPEGLPKKLRITGLVEDDNVFELEAGMRVLVEEASSQRVEGSLKAILQALKKLSPSVLTLVEQDANHNGPFFLGRFLESLHFYSAIFDSLEVSLPPNSPQRTKIERLHFADEIRNIVAFEGLNRVERHERADQWRRQLGRAGFQVMGLKCTSQARMMLSVYGCDGYSLASEKGCLLLGWKGRPIMLAAAWQVNNASSS
ncbi:hypothetical protein ACLB2K_025539 [Fragaria x ananassa]